MRAAPALVLLLCSVPAFGAETAAPPDTCAADSVSFMPLNVYIDPGGQPLAAYQVELSDTSGSSTIVGIEGGEHPAFHQPPYYDPAALQAYRIVLAAFSTARDLPCSRVRVATVHLMTKTAVTPTFVPLLQVAATRDGSRIRAQASCELGDAR
jgi:hypothetical protein